MKSIYILLIGLGLTSLVSAQQTPRPPIQSDRFDKCAMRLSYSDMARYNNDVAWSYAISSNQPGVQRETIVDLAAVDPATKVKSCRHWQLPLANMVTSSMTMIAKPNDEVAIVVEAEDSAKKRITCSFIYGFTTEGKLRSTLTDEGCSEK